MNTIRSLVNPSIILVEPQLGENIGMVARAMLNCELTDLRLVRPRDSWPNEKAKSAASGADQVLDNAKIFHSTSDAISDLNLVYAATARDRDMTKLIISPTQAAREVVDAGSKTCGVIFGSEASGLSNDDVALADSTLLIPTNPSFPSLNLAQAVLIFAHELYTIKTSQLPTRLTMQASRPAEKKEILGLFSQLEEALDKSGFFRVREKRPTMVRNLRNIIQRARLTKQEVRTLRGVVTSLKNWKPKKTKI